MMPTPHASGRTEEGAVVSAAAADPDSGADLARAADARLRMRRRFLLGLVTGAVLTAGAGLGASTLIKSPQQVAAEAEPPQASVITAPVEKRVLKQTVVSRGTVQPRQSFDVKPVLGQGRSVITKTTVSAGDAIKPGTVVAEISGRPVIALKGRIPPYRAIEPGMKGPDVEQLQEALRELGLRISDEDGTFGPSTRKAVRKMYDNRGYEPPLTRGSSSTGDAVEPQTGEGQPAAGEGQPQTGEGQPAAGAQPAAEPEPEVYVPMSELVFVRSFPARVTRVTAGLGAEVSGAVLTLSLGELVVRGVLSKVDRQLVDTGMPVAIYSEADDKTAAGKVTAIGQFQQGGEQEGGGEGEEQSSAPTGYPITVEGVRDLPQAFSGQNVRLTIEAASTGKAVLAVPAAAIFAAADGTTQVVQLLDGGQQRPVPLKTGASAGGFVQVETGELTVGDRVVVGQDSGGGANDQVEVGPPGGEGG